MESVNAVPQTLQPGTRPSRDHNRRRNPQQSGRQGAQFEATRPSVTANATPQPSSNDILNATVTSNGDARSRGNRAHRRRGGPQDRVQSSVTRTATDATPRSDSSRVMVGSGRQFGGRLTSTSTETQTAPNTTSTLHAGAPEFHPVSQQSVHSSESTSTRSAKTNTNAPRHPRQSGRNPKSSAPDLATRIHEDVENGVYECPICAYEVGRKSKLYKEMVTKRRLRSCGASTER
ncbi:MAG: FKBP12-associated protein [Peltula sp. TS41687]|nr:MAG: FKBP12-associated protein [Peltula sp. TS41687]